VQAKRSLATLLQVCFSNRHKPPRLVFFKYIKTTLSILVNTIGNSKNAFSAWISGPDEDFSVRNYSRFTKHFVIHIVTFKKNNLFKMKTNVIFIIV
jgi:hypothetical protein